jgi:hypothetical protein
MSWARGPKGGPPLARDLLFRGSQAVSENLTAVRKWTPNGRILDHGTGALGPG